MVLLWGDKKKMRGAFLFVNKVIICLKDQSLKNKGAGTRSSSQDQRDAKISSMSERETRFFSLNIPSCTFKTRADKDCIFLSTFNKTYI